MRSMITDRIGSVINMAFADNVIVTPMFVIIVDIIFIADDV